MKTGQARKATPRVQCAGMLPNTQCWASSIRHEAPLMRVQRLAGPRNICGERGSTHHAKVIQWQCG